MKKQKKRKTNKYYIEKGNATLRKGTEKLLVVWTRDGVSLELQNWKKDE